MSLTSTSNASARRALIASRLGDRVRGRNLVPVPAHQPRQCPHRIEVVLYEQHAETLLVLGFAVAAVGG
jgi:hypothetical protein